MIKLKKYATVFLLTVTIGAGCMSLNVRADENCPDIVATEIITEINEEESTITTGTLGLNNRVLWSYDSANKTLTVTGGEYYFSGESRQGQFWSGFYNICSDVEKIILNDFTFGIDAHAFFANLTSLETVEFNNCDASQTVSLSNMFYRCSSLKSIDLSTFSTANITSMTSLFNGCSSLTDINLKGIDTSQVTDMYAMFSGCSSLKEIDLSSFNTSNVTDMRFMFDRCSGLTELNITNFDTSKVTAMGSMFNFCKSLTGIDLRNFNTSNVTDMTQLFCRCFNLTKLDLSNFDTSKVVNMSDMFYYCEKLTTLDLSSFNTANVTDMTYMFANSGITDLNISSFDTSNVTNTSGTFYNTRYLGRIKAPKTMASEQSFILGDRYYKYDTATSTLLDYNYTQYLTPDCCNIILLNFENVSKELVIKPVTVKTRSTTEGKNVIKWTANSDADGYIVMRKTSKTGEWEVIEDIADPAILRYEDANVVSRTRYYYTVKAYIQFEGVQVYSKYDNDTTGVKTSIATVKLSDVIASDGTNMIIWESLSNVSGYVIKRKAEGSSKWTTVAVVAGASKNYYVDSKSLTAGKKYTYTVFAMGYKSDDNGTYSKYGKFDKNGITVTSTLKIPTLQTPKASIGKITVKWNKANGADGYVIYRKAEGASEWTKAGTVAAKGTKTVYAYIDTAVKAKSKYTYTVMAYYTDSEGKKVDGNYDSAGKSVTAK